MKDAFKSLWAHRVSIIVITLVLAIVFCVPAIIVVADANTARITFEDAPTSAVIIETLDVEVTDKSVTSNSMSRHHVYYIASDGSAGEFSISAEDYARINIGDTMQRTTYVLETSYWSGFLTVVECLAIMLVLVALVFFVILIA